MQQEQVQLSSHRSAQELRKSFFQVLRTRRAQDLPFTLTQVEPPTTPLYQTNWLGQDEVMLSCPRGHNGEVKAESLHLRSEDGDQGIVPIIVVKCNVQKYEGTAPAKRPAVVFLHPSFKNKEWLMPLLKAYASRGYVAVGVDSRYHGERANSKNCYMTALASAWTKGDTFPFIYDTVWDLMKLMDYLCEREDIDPKRIGVTGESLGGMIAWFAAAMDIRYAVAVPIIGVQSFQWAIDNYKWHERVASISDVFEVAKADLDKDKIDAGVVTSVWNKLAPGLITEFDASYSIPIICPRPLLIINGTEDPRCPIEGLADCVSKTRAAYTDANVPGNFKFIAVNDVGHSLTCSMVQEASDWMDKFLQPII